ncbi:protein of unknown function [Frankineae bacterium MT45]|nr:protein of unknown function [Frankineae bacterium MT45]
MVEGPDQISGVGASAKVAALLGPLSEAINAVFGAQLESFTSAELLELLQGWESCTRREVAVDHLLVAALMARGLADEYGFSAPAALLADLLRLDPREAKARVRAAEDLGPRTGFTGEPLESVFPLVAAEQKAGAISARHAQVIVATLGGLSAELDFEHGAAIQATLVEQSRWFAPNELAKVAARIVAHLDPDGAAPTDAKQQRDRCFTLGKRDDGMVIPTGALTPACGAASEAVLDSLSAPLPVTDSDGGVLEPDRRTPAQRRHDALLDASRRLLADGGLPNSGGVATTLLITMTEEQFRTQRGFASTSHGDLISIPETMSLAEEADVVSVVLNAEGGVLSHGRTRRLASPAQRLALFARDRGCTFPSCSIPAQWTQVHHQTPWQYGGETSVQTTALLCGHHHRNFEKMGWSLTMPDGVPWWVPPRHIDPAQTPRRNHRHHPPNAATGMAPV